VKVKNIVANTSNNVTSVIRRCAARSIQLYFDPLRRLWRRSFVGADHIAASDYLWALHEFITLVAGQEPRARDRQSVQAVFVHAEEVVVADVCTFLRLRSLSESLTPSATPDETRASVLAAYTQGYIAGLLREEVGAAKWIASMSRLYEYHDEVTRAIHKIRLASLYADVA
jgi:hypothetical protein